MKSKILVGSVLIALVLLSTTVFAAPTNTTSSPTAEAGDWINADRAYDDDGTGYAETLAKTIENVYYNYGFSLTGETIDSVRVRVDHYEEDNNDYVRVQISCDAGANYGDAFNTVNCQGAECTIYLNVTADSVCGGFTPTKLNDANFRVKVISVAVQASGDYWRLDWIPVEVLHTTAPSNLEVTLTLPGVAGVTSADGEGTTTEDIEFNATHFNEYNVEPCVVPGGSCQAYSSGTPIFNFSNTGDVEVNISIKINETMPATMTLWGNNESSPTGSYIATLGTGWWEVNASVPANGWTPAYLFANFTGVKYGDATVKRNITSNATQIA